MFVAALRCAQGHAFDGWFDRASDVEEALSAGDAPCPQCGSVDVQRRPAFRGIGKGGRGSAPADAGGAAGDDGAPSRMPLPVQRALSKLLDHVRRHGEDAGDQFAAKARAVHRGEEPARLLYGTSTPDERRALVDEGVPFTAVPVPDVDVN